MISWFTTSFRFVCFWCCSTFFITDRKQNNWIFGKFSISIFFFFFYIKTGGADDVRAFFSFWRFRRRFERDVESPEAVWLYTNALVNKRKTNVGWTTQHTCRWSRADHCRSEIATHLCLYHWQRWRVVAWSHLAWPLRRLMQQRTH